MLRFFWRWAGGKTYPPVTVAQRPGAGGRREPAAGPDPGEPVGFADAVQFFNVTDAQLRGLHRRHAARFYFLLGGALFALSFGVTTAFLRGGPARALLAVLLALLFLAAAAGSSLRAWQIRERHLHAFGDWIHRPRAWFPPIVE
ncbi:MAG: hypothetical protein IPL99_08775 [Candidatus Competibacteraceae bacterium]|nr:hypothetical protein [Candidatus Competibacteraceae bacterium]